MKVELEWAELHAPLFLGGKNHQTKLIASKRTGMRLVYDRGEKELIVIWIDPKGKQCVAIVPFHGTTNNVWPKDPAAFLAALELPPVKEDAPAQIKTSTSSPKVTAQVETPQSHVFGGHGAGKTR